MLDGPNFAFLRLSELTGADPLNHKPPMADVMITSSFAYLLGIGFGLFFVS